MLREVAGVGFEPEIKNQLHFNKSVLKASCHQTNGLNLLQSLTLYFTSAPIWQL